MEARDIKGWPRFPSHDLLNRTRPRATLRNYEDLACGHVSISKDSDEKGGSSRDDELLSLYNSISKKILSPKFFHTEFLYTYHPSV